MGAGGGSPKAGSRARRSSSHYHWLYGSSAAAAIWRSSSNSGRRSGNPMGGMLWLLPPLIRNMLPVELPLAPVPAAPCAAAAPSAEAAAGASATTSAVVAPAVAGPIPQTLGPCAEAGAVIGPAPMPPAALSAASSLASLRVPPLQLGALRGGRLSTTTGAGAGAGAGPGAVAAGTPRLLLSGAGSSFLLARHASLGLGAPLRSLDAVKSLPPPAYLHAGTANPPSANNQPYR